MEGHTGMESGDNATNGSDSVESTAKSPSIREVQSEMVVTPSSQGVEVADTTHCSFNPILSRASLTPEAEKPSEQRICHGSEGSPRRALVSATREEQIDHNTENASQNLERVATPELSNAEMVKNCDHISPVDDSSDVLEAGKQTGQNVKPSLDAPSTNQTIVNDEINTEQAIISPVPASQEEDKTKDVVGLSTEIIPATTSEVPATASEVPVTTSEVSATASEVPTTASEVPVTASEVPATASEVPVIPSEVPATASEVPVIPLEVPATASEVPATASEVPATASEVPATASEVPVIPSEVPATASEVPVIPSEVPATASEVPVIPSEVPATASEVPATASEVPVIPSEVPAIASEVPATSSEVSTTASEVSATASEGERKSNENDRPRLDSTSSGPVVETAQDTPSDHVMIADQPSDTAGPQCARVGEENADIDSEAVGSVSTEEQPKETADIHVSTEPLVVPTPPDAKVKDKKDANIDSVDSVEADSTSTEEHSQQTAAIHVSAEPKVIPVPPDAEIIGVNYCNIDPVDSVTAGSVSTEEQPEQTADVHVEPSKEPTRLDASTKENSDTAGLVVTSAAITTCNRQQIANSVEINLPAPVISIQPELGKESSSAESITINEPNSETAIVGIESGAPAPDLSMPTVEPISASEAQHAPHTISSYAPRTSSPVESRADFTGVIVVSNNSETTIPESGSTIGTLMQIKNEKSPDSENLTFQNEQLDETSNGDYSGGNEIELSEYQWSNDQSFQSEGNVSQNYETDGDPNAERSWQGQAMLEMIDYQPGDPLHSAGTEGEMPNLNFCIDSVRGDVPWPLSGGEDEGNDVADVSEQVEGGHRISFKRRRRGRGRGGVDVLALPYLRQKNRAATADGYYSLNSNVKGLIAWLNHSKGPYTMTVTQFGFKVVEEPQDAAATTFICELCKVDYTDVEIFLGHCREKVHFANKVSAVKRSLNLYVRQGMARTRKKQEEGGVVNTVSTEGAGLAPNLHELTFPRGGYRGGYRGRGRGRPMKPKLQQSPNPLLPKRGRGRPRKIQPDSTSFGTTEGNQPLLNALPFEKTKPPGEEDKRILRVKPLPRQEDGRVHYGDVDSPECAMGDEACDSDGPPPLTVPGAVVHDTSLSGILSPKRALFDHSETSPGHSAEPRRKRQRYSTENPQESDASSTSTSVRSHRRSSWEPMDPPQYEDHTPTKTSPGEVLKRGRGRPPKTKSTSASSPVAQTSNSLGISSGISLAQALPVPIVKLERTTPEKLLSMSSERVQPGPSSTVTSASTFGNEELLNSLTDEQLWAELIERKTVHSCTCGFAFSTSSAYYLHKACHNTVNEKTCSFCGLEATNWMMFHAHFFNHKAPT